MVENQRRLPKKYGIDKWSAAALRDKDDCPPWSLPDLTAAQPKQDVLPQKGYQWCDKWEISSAGEI